MIFIDQALYLYSYIFIRTIILIMIRVLKRNLRLNANFSSCYFLRLKRPLKILTMPWYFRCSIRGANRE